MAHLLRETGDRIRETGSVLWRCIYSVSLTLVCSLGLVLIPQGLECLRLVVQPGWNFPLFILSVLAWSLAAWYSARLTLGRVFDTSSLLDRTDTPFVNWQRIWLPRVLGVMPFTLLAVAFVRLALWPYAGAALVGAAAMAWLVLAHKVWFAPRFPDWRKEGHEARFIALQARTVRTVVVSIVLSFLLLGAIWLWPVQVTAVFTAPVLLCFAFASWILFGDLVLTYLFRQAGLPSMAGLPLLLLVVFSPINDNHGVRTLPLAAHEGPPRRDVRAHADAWLRARAAAGELQRGRPFPLFLVAAEGGGLRAAYWGGSVLARLQDDSGGRFGRHVLAISGVSGGSLAAGVYAALQAEAAHGGLARLPCAASLPARPWQACTRQVLRNDLLSPTLGYLLYPDMVQRFLPWPMEKADRALALERALETAWENAVANARLGQPLARLWQDDSAFNVPSLLLNATLVSTGSRLIASDLHIDGRFPDAYEAFDPGLDLAGAPLSAAIHNSARFSWVSPAGTVYACHDALGPRACSAGATRAPWGRVIDGGYFENSGVESVRDLLVALAPVLRAWGEQGYAITPAVIVISNSPDARSPTGLADPARVNMEPSWLAELVAPPLGLYNTRRARAAFAVAALRRDLGPEAGFHWFGMDNGQPTALGWALSASTFARMDAMVAPPLDRRQPFAAVLRQLDASAKP
jgi:hypothetical protein